MLRALGQQFVESQIPGGNSVYPRQPRSTRCTLYILRAWRDGAVVQTTAGTTKNNNNSNQHHQELSPSCSEGLRLLLDSRSHQSAGSGTDSFYAHHVDKAQKRIGHTWKAADMAAISGARTAFCQAKRDVAMELRRIESTPTRLRTTLKTF